MCCTVSHSAVRFHIICSRRISFQQIFYMYGLRRFAVLSNQFTQLHHELSYQAYPRCGHHHEYYRKKEFYAEKPQNHTLILGHRLG